MNLIISDNSLNSDIKKLYLSKYSKNKAIELFDSKEFKCLDSNVNRSVEIASGKYVWIFGDDDIIVPGILSELITFLKRNSPDLLILNSKTFRGKEIVENSRLPKGIKSIYGQDENDMFLINMAGYLTYVGGICVKKELWLKHYDKSKIGTFFAHIKCLASLKEGNIVHYLSSPAIQMRLGSQTWTDNSFLIWYKFYPEIIWGLEKYSNYAKEKVINKTPLNSLKSICAARAFGRIGFATFKKNIFYSRRIFLINKILIFLSLIIPSKLFAIVYIRYILFFRKKHTINFSPNLALSNLRNK